MLKALCRALELVKLDKSEGAQLKYDVTNSMINVWRRCWRLANQGVFLLPLYYTVTLRG